MSKKSYRSPLREEQAERTRRAIRDATRALLEEVGFAGATIAGIAARAGVSQPTVYAVYGSKAGIVRAMLELLEEEAELPRAIEGMLAERDPRRQLRLFVSSHRRMLEAGASLIRASADARSSPDVAAFHEAGNAKRRQGIEVLVSGWSAAKVLRLPKKRAVETMWLLTSAEVFLLALDTLGWSPAVYERWLMETIERELFAE